MMKKTNVPVGAALSETQITQFCQTANRRRHQRMSLIHKERLCVVDRRERHLEVEEHHEVSKKKRRAEAKCERWHNGVMKKRK